jgi:hypothetical protein
MTTGTAILVYVITYRIKVFAPGHRDASGLERDLPCRPSSDVHVLPADVANPWGEPGPSGHDTPFVACATTEMSCLSLEQVNV